MTLFFDDDDDDEAVMRKKSNSNKSMLKDMFEIVFFHVPGT